MNFLRWLRALILRRRLEDEMAEEMRAHVEARAADLVRRGVPEQEALRLAHLEFGSRERYKEEGREARGYSFIDGVRFDLRTSLRSLLRTPVFTATALATLAIGVGANATIFSILDGVVLKPLTYPDPQRLYTARTTFPGNKNPDSDSPISRPLFLRWREACDSCENMALIGSVAVNLGGLGEYQRVDALIAEWRLFPMLGTRMQLGRAFTSEDDRPGAALVVIISDALWRGALGADPSVIGRKVIWNATQAEVIGVLPPDFRFPKGEQMGAMTVLPDRVDIIRPMQTDPARPGPMVFMYSALVKLREGVSTDQALAEINREFPGPAPTGAARGLIRLLPLQERMTGSIRRPLLLLTGAAGVLLLIVCVNLGNLLLVRASGRQRDWAIRTAIGASRASLIRHVFVESFLLALTGGALGIAASAGGLWLMGKLAPATLPRLDEVALDWRVLLATLGISALAGLLCGLAPLWRIVRADPQHALAAGSPRASDTRVDRRIRHALVGGETGLSMALAAVAGLLIVSFVRVLNVEKGFDAQHVLTFGMSLEGQYAGQQRAQYHQELLASLRALPGVTDVGLTSQLPLQGEIWVSNLRRPGGLRPALEVPRVNYRFVSPGYFPAAGVPVRRGRSFDESDRQRNVVLISERAAQRAFPGEDPIGQIIDFGEDGGPELLEIIGVTGDVKSAGLESEEAMIAYLPYWRLGLGTAFYVVRASGDESALVPAVRAAAANVKKDVPLHRIRTMEAIVDTAAAPRRLQTLLAGGFAAIGVLLTCLGVFGVVSYTVARRSGELGVRMALGATRAQVMAMVLRESMTPVLIGLAAGWIAALGLGRVLSSQLYGVRPDDPLVLGGVALVVTAAALVAAYAPALRAARVEISQVLRWE